MPRSNRSRMPETLIAPPEAVIGPSRARRALRTPACSSATGARATRPPAPRWSSVSCRWRGRWRGATSAAAKSLDDLMQVASLALLKAIDRFDRSGGGVLRVCGADDRRRAQTLLPRLRLVGAGAARPAGARAAGPARVGQLTARLGRSPPPAGIADELDIGVERRARSARRRERPAPRPARCAHRPRR